MTGSDDRIDTAVEAFLDHLEGRGDRPTLGDLAPGDRDRVGWLLTSLEAGRGIDPDATRPTLDALLAGTPLASLLDAPTTGSGSEAEPDLLARITTELTRYLPFHAEVWPDAAAAALGIRSDFVARIAAQRLRIQVRHDLSRPADLAGLDPAAAAGPIYGAFGDTGGVLVVHPDHDLSSVAIDPFDIEHLIGTPGGGEEGPRIRRPVLPLADSVRAYIDEVAPVLDASIDPSRLAVGEVDIAAAARSAASRAVSSIVAAGTRAKIDSKQLTWGALGRAEIDAISDLVLDALDGLEEAELAARIAGIGEAA